MPGDEIVQNAYELLGRAEGAVRALSASGYRPPMKPAQIRVAGRSGIATITAQLVNMRDGGFISPHDFHLGRTIAEVMCGGDLDTGALVDEQWLLDRERQAFMSLLNHPKTQERIMGMMQTGKPVRNSSLPRARRSARRRAACSVTPDRMTSWCGSFNPRCSRSPVSIRRSSRMRSWVVRFPKQSRA
jgi:hypothetical protein